jgi:hypothetical protein
MAMTERSTTPRDGQQEESRPAWWNPWNWPGGIWVLVIGSLLFATPFTIRAFMLSGVPVIAEPFDFDEFAKWEVPTEENAFTDYRQAAELHTRLLEDLKSQGVVNVREPADYTVFLDQGWSVADDSTKKWLELHHEALTIWRRGTEKTRGRNLSPADFTFNTQLDVIQGMRTFVRLAMIEESRLIAEGNLDEARQWARAAFRSGGHTTHRGSMIQGLVGVAIHAMSSNGLVRWAEQPAVTSEQLKQALADARSDFRLYESRSNILKAEYLMLRNTFTSAKWTEMIAGVDPGQAAAAIPMKMGYWVVGEPELTVRLCRQILANQLPEIEKPLSMRRSVVGTGTAMLFDPDPTVTMPPGQLDPAEIDRCVKRSSLMRVVSPVMIQYDTAMLRQQAKQAVLEVALAAHAYRRDLGEFPPSLSELLPNYLPAVPPDPCDPSGGPLLYRRDQALKAVVWSVGDDRVDSGGAVDSKNNRPADVGFLLKDDQGAEP